jgi:hypothetical protein
MPHAYGNIGDLAVLLGHYNTSDYHITEITGTQSGTWTRRFQQVNTDLPKTTDIWTAPVKDTSFADVLTITYSGSMTNITSNYWPDSITAGLGANTVWTFPAGASGSTSDTTGSVTTIDYPSLTSATTTNPQAYLGVDASTGTATEGSTPTPGFSYIDSTISGNEMVYDLSLDTNTVYAPTSTQTAGSYLTAGIIIEAAAATQTISMASTGSTTIGQSGTYNVTASTNDTDTGVSLVYTVDGTATDSAVCSVTRTGVVSFTGLGVCTIDVNSGATENYGAAAQAQQVLTVNTTPPPPPPPPPVTVTLTQGSPTSAGVAYGAGYSGQLTVPNGTETVSYTETSSTDSADVVVTSTGAISAATSLAPGTYTVTGTDSDTKGDTGTWSFTLTVTANKLLQVTPTTATTTPGKAFTGQLEVSGSHGTVSYAQSTGAPQLTVSSSGAVSASATLTVGTYKATGTVKDSLADTGTWSFTLTVTANKLIQVTPTTGTTTTSKAFTSQLKVSGSHGTVGYVQSTGAPQLTVSSSGAVSGSATLTVGTYKAAGIASDTLGDTGTWSFTLTVGMAASTTALSLSATKVTYGDEQVEHLSVTVSPQYSGVTPTGTITIKESTTTLCVIHLPSVKGSCNLSNVRLQVGTYSLVATYGGSTNFEGSASVKKILTVTKATSKTTLKLSSSKVTYGHEQTEHLSVMVSPEFAGSTPTGRVTIEGSGTTLCVITLSSGKGSCTLSVKRVKAGTYRFAATYGRSTNFEGSTSAKETLTVAK